MKSLVHGAGGNTGIPWGSYNVWDEPFDDAVVAAARKTLEHIENCHQKAKQVRFNPLVDCWPNFDTLYCFTIHCSICVHALQAAPSATGGAAPDDESDEESEHGSPRSTGPAAGAQVPSDTANTACRHLACSRQAFCFVQKLETYKAMYGSAVSDQHRKFKIQVGFMCPLCSCCACVMNV